MARISLPDDIATWLAAQASALDRDEAVASSLLPQLGRAGLFTIGAPKRFGGDGEQTTEAIEAIAAVSELSLAAGFVFWGHRTYLEYLLQSPSSALRDRLAPAIVRGEVAGATALSNAMKFLAGLEGLQIEAREKQGRILLDGKMPWVTNLRKEGFHVAAAVARQDGSSFIASLRHDVPGLVRSPDLDLISMRATNTAAVRLAGVEITDEDIIAPDAQAWLPAVRPAFLGLQCGMSIGLARRALNEALAAVGAGRSVLSPEIDALSQRLATETKRLHSGVSQSKFQADPAALFRIRIALADIVSEAVELELQAGGGACYLSQPGEHFARRWREAAFIPVVTPSLVQLKAALAAHAALGRAA
ncbi:MAG: acyl-CoA dehydrogenase family protein [Beijerinckiaceae bacterium]|nr:acyl-CoA dehydrogenase family protein [Beijerinckiaceae bacterium]